MIYSKLVFVSNYTWPESFIVQNLNTTVFKCGGNSNFILVFTFLHKINCKIWLSQVLLDFSTIFFHFEFFLVFSLSGNCFFFGTTRKSKYLKNLFGYAFNIIFINLNPTMKSNAHTENLQFNSTKIRTKRKL